MVEQGAPTSPPSGQLGLEHVPFTQLSGEQQVWPVLQSVPVGAQHDGDEESVSQTSAPQHVSPGVHGAASATHKHAPSVHGPLAQHEVASPLNGAVQSSFVELHAPPSGVRHTYS